MGLGDRLCVGDPGRLSLEDREWWRPEEKLRLVWSTEDGLEIFLNRDFRLGTCMVTVREAAEAEEAGAPLPARLTDPGSRVGGCACSCGPCGPWSRSSAQAPP